MLHFYGINGHPNHSGSDGKIKFPAYGSNHGSQKRNVSSVRDIKTISKHQHQYASSPFGNGNMFSSSRMICTKNSIDQSLQSKTFPRTRLDFRMSWTSSEHHTMRFSKGYRISFLSNSTSGVNLLHTPGCRETAMSCYASTAHAEPW